MRRTGFLFLIAILGGLTAAAEIQLPASLVLVGPLDDLQSSLGDEISNYPFGRGFGAGPVHGWISITFSPPVGRVAKFRLRWQTVGDEPGISFATGHFFNAKSVANFSSAVQVSEGELNLDTGAISNLEIHAVFQNVLVHKTARNNRFPLSSHGTSFSVLFGDYPPLDFPFPLPFSERPPISMSARFVLDSSQKITGFEFRGTGFIPITVVPKVALMPTYSFAPRGETIIPGADGCLPNTIPPSQCLSEQNIPDGITSPFNAFLSPTLVMISRELREVSGPPVIPPAQPGGVTLGATAAASAGRLYTFGGFDGQRVLNRASVFDPARNQWSVLPNIPSGVWQACSAAAGGKLYLVGGRESTGETQIATVRVLDPGASIWSTVASMPIVVANAGCAALDDRLYVFGGFTSSGAASDLAWFYDPAFGQWMPLARMPSPMAGSAVAVAERDIYVVNGTSDGRSATNRVLIFSPASGTWREGPATNRAVYGASAAFLNGRLFLAGGRLAVDGPLDIGDTLFQTQAMQVLVQGRTWFAALHPPLPAAEMAGAVVGDIWYLVGGDTASAPQREPTDIVQTFAAARGWLVSDTHPVFTSTRIRNSASLAVGPAELAPGGLASILGYHLSRETRQAPPVRFSGGFFTTDLPQELAGIRITVDGQPAGIVSVSLERIDFQVPFAVSAGSVARLVPVQVSRAGVAASPVLVRIVESAPALFIYSHSETRAINYLHQSAAVAYSSNGRLNYAAQPTRVGETIVLLGTGLGDVNPRPEPFSRAPRDRASTALKIPEVFIDNQPATVQTVRLAAGETGTYEIWVTVPTGVRTGFRVPVRLRVSNIDSNEAVIAIQ